MDRHTGNSIDRVAVRGGVTDTVAGRREHPETLGVVDLGVLEGTLVLVLVDVAEVVATGGFVLQGRCKQRGVKLGLDGVEEGGLGLGLDYMG